MSNKIYATLDLGDFLAAVKKLETIPDDIKNKQMRIAMNAAGGVVKNVAKTKAQSRYGYLKRSFAVKVNRNKKTGDYSAIVGIGKNKSFDRKYATKEREEYVSKRRITINKEFKGFGFFNRTRAVMATYRISPARYLHLAERAKRGGFMRLASSISKTAVTWIAARKILEFLQKQKI